MVSLHERFKNKHSPNIFTPLIIEPNIWIDLFFVSVILGWNLWRLFNLVGRCNVDIWFQFSTRLSIYSFENFFSLQFVNCSNFEVSGILFPTKNPSNNSAETTTNTNFPTTFYKGRVSWIGQRLFHFYLLRVCSTTTWFFISPISNLTYFKISSCLEYA